MTTRLREAAGLPGIAGKDIRFYTPKIGVAVIIVALIAFELETSWLQSHVFSAIGRHMSYAVEPGPNLHPPSPRPGPFDVRLGYALLPSFIERLEGAGYRITAQARNESSLGRLASRFFSPVYREKNQAGLNILDRAGQPLRVARYPQRAYPDFDAIPSTVVSSLLFIENREILDERYPYRNPAVDWDRFGKAILDLGYSGLDPSHPVSGGSTLATQLEKMRHSPGGRTNSSVDKIRQMAAASLRAYLDGARTLEARKRIICDYLNAIPLAARPGYGEVNGLGDGLQAWFGADFDTVNRLMRETETGRAPVIRGRQAQAFRQVLSLLLAIKKPTIYLVKDRKSLDARVDAYLKMLEKQGIISSSLRDAALRIPAGYRDAPPEPDPVPHPENKATDAVRRELLALLGMKGSYGLDHLDLAVLTTIDRKTQNDVARELGELADRKHAAGAGLYGERLLGNGDPSRIVYGFTLFERTPRGNLLRVQADNYDAPLDINEGTKLELGSTAKLRTLIHYLEIVAELHAGYAGLSPEELESLSFPRQDRLARWAVEYLATAKDKGLPAMIGAALDRKYSASPGEMFFTGGGLQSFANFDRTDNARIMSVREAFRRSVNLVFIRLMRDIVNYHIERLPGVTPQLLDDPRDPGRQILLARFADREGRTFLARFEEKYRGRDPDEMLRTLLQGVRSKSAVRLAVIYRSVRPQDPPERFAAFLRTYPDGASLTDEEIGAYHVKYGPDRYDLRDRGYLAGVHPLELWLVEYLSRNPAAKLDAILGASAAERQDVYRWLFRTKWKGAQDRRIRTLLEADAFGEIHKSWQRLGYPFGSLVPSYATAIGSSGDNPAALAELMGIIASDGVRYRDLRILRLRFAEGTPVETVIDPPPSQGRRVLPALLAEAVKRELVGVVEKGTARSIARTIVLPDGTPVAVGGKTGTGDNRYVLFAKGGRMTGYRVVNRTAVFAFIIGDRFFGTVTAFVPGPRAADYDFTSALPVRLLRHIAPTLMPLISASAPDTTKGQGVSALPPSGASPG